jgi:hypothetical protein
MALGLAIGNLSPHAKKNSTAKKGGETQQKISLL